MSLSSIYAEYLNSKKEEKVRDPKRLFLSDIGKCPRQVAYRLLQTPEEYESEQEKINKTIMFDLAEHIEETLWKALEENGMGVAYQPEIPMPDRENWGGRGDIIADYLGRRVLEVKSIYPGAFKHDIDYATHQHQARSYDHYLSELYKLDAPPLVPYFDRGGQNTPQEVLVDKTWEETCALMDELDEVRGNLPDLPPQRERRVFLRSWDKEIVWGPHTDCRLPYCKYIHTACHVSETVNVWATRKKEGGLWTPWDVKKAADPEILMPFIDSLIDNAMEGA